MPRAKLSTVDERKKKKKGTFVTSDCVFRSVTKEEKEKENTRKVAPVTATMTMPPAGRPSSVQARPIHGILQDDSKAVRGC